MIGLIARKIFGSKNDREVKKLRPLVTRVNELEAKLRELPEETLRQKTAAWRAELSGVGDDGKLAARLEEILPEAFAVVKNACRRLCGQEVTVREHALRWDMVPFDVQLIGGISLHRGFIAEMATGEGKTLVATMPAYLNALTGRGVHVATVNDYLAARDSEWMCAVYRFLGLTVGCVLHDQPPRVRREQYARDITYGTVAEFGFDYLRQDGRASHRGDQVQRGHYFAIVDEVDSILLDEARAPITIVEANEIPAVERKPQRLATITIQNYFRLYQKLAGMSGSAEVEASEFFEAYKLGVLVIPTERPVARQDGNDSVYKTKREKLDAVVNEVKAVHAQGRPVLVGTISAEVSEMLSGMLSREGIIHSVLHGKYHQQEAEIVTGAGQPGAVTIAMNMAGRGTDIKLGPGVAEAGGLHVIGTERHEARRIDRQLRGRCARQGDPGSSHFFISLEDDLMRLFGSDKIVKYMEKMGLEEGQELEHPLLNRSIGQAQKRVEQHNFEIRKRTLANDMTNEQRVAHSEEDNLGMRQETAETAMAYGAAAKGPNSVQQAQQALAAGAATKVLNFQESMQNRFHNHLRLIQHLKKVGAFPRMTVCAITSVSPGASFPRRIIVTGSLAEAQKLEKLYYLPETEAFVAQEFRNDWDSINAYSSDENFSAPGCTVDLRSYERNVADIKAGRYEVETVIDCTSASEVAPPPSEKEKKITEKGGTFSEKTSRAQIIVGSTSHNEGAPAQTATAVPMPTRPEQAALNLYEHHLYSVLVQANLSTELLQRLGDAVGHVRDFKNGLTFSALKDPQGKCLDLTGFERLGPMEVHSFTQGILSKLIAEKMTTNAAVEEDAYKPLTPKRLDTLKSTIKREIADENTHIVGGFNLSEGIVRILSRSIFGDAISIRCEKLAAASIDLDAEQRDPRSAPCAQPEPARGSAT